MFTWHQQQVANTNNITQDCFFDFEHTTRQIRETVEFQYEHKPERTQTSKAKKDEKVATIFVKTTTIHSYVKQKEIRKQTWLACSVFRVQLPIEALEIQSHEVAESWKHF